MRLFILLFIGFCLKLFSQAPVKVKRSCPNPSFCNCNWETKRIECLCNSEICKNYDESFIDSSNGSIEDFSHKNLKGFHEIYINNVQRYHTHYFYGSNYSIDFRLSLQSPRIIEKSFLENVTGINYLEIIYNDLVQIDKHAFDLFKCETLSFISLGKNFEFNIDIFGQNLFLQNLIIDFHSSSKIRHIFTQTNPEWIRIKKENNSINKTVLLQYWSSHAKVKKVYIQEAKGVSLLDYSWVPYFENLERIEFYYTDISRISKSFTLLHSDNLKYLTIRQSKLEVIEAHVFELLKNLEHLDISSNPIRLFETESFYGLNRLRSLTLLSISDTYVIDDSDICLLSYLPCNVQVYLDKNDHHNCAHIYLNELRNFSNEDDLVLKPSCKLDQSLKGCLEQSKRNHHCLMKKFNITNLNFTHKAMPKHEYKTICYTVTDIMNTTASKNDYNNSTKKTSTSTIDNIIESLNSDQHEILAEIQLEVESTQSLSTYIETLLPKNKIETSSSRSLQITTGIKASLVPTNTNTNIIYEADYKSSNSNVLLSSTQDYELSSKINEIQSIYQDLPAVKGAIPSNDTTSSTSTTLTTIFKIATTTSVITSSASISSLSSTSTVILSPITTSTTTTITTTAKTTATTTATTTSKTTATTTASTTSSSSTSSATSLLISASSTSALFTNNSLSTTSNKETPTTSSINRITKASTSTPIIIIQTPTQSLAPIISSTYSIASSNLNTSTTTMRSTQSSNILILTNSSELRTTSALKINSTSTKLEYPLTYDSTLHQRSAFTNPIKINEAPKLISSPNYDFIESTTKQRSNKTYRNRKNRTTTTKKTFLTSILDNRNSSEKKLHQSQNFSNEIGESRNEKEYFAALPNKINDSPFPINSLNNDKISAILNNTENQKQNNLLLILIVSLVIFCIVQFLIGLFAFYMFYRNRNRCSQEEDNKPIRNNSAPNNKNQEHSTSHAQSNHTDELTEPETEHPSHDGKILRTISMQTGSLSNNFNNSKRSPIRPLSLFKQAPKFTPRPPIEFLRESSISLNNYHL